MTDQPAFIRGYGETGDLQHPVTAPQFRKRFWADSPQQARLRICGLGFYDAYLNGERIGNAELKPYITDYTKRVYYEEYDVLPLLRPGENVLAVRLGNGMYNCAGGYTWNFDTAPWRDVPKLAAELILATASGERRIETDESWRVADSPVWFNDLRCGEYYDARREQDGWMLPGFDDSGWQPAVCAVPPTGEWVCSQAEEITVIRRIAPKKIVPLEEGTYCYDFGENTAGVCELSVEGQSGQEIRLEFVERVDEQYRPADSMIREFAPPGMFQVDRYILRGNGREVWRPQFVYHGFRYVVVSGVQEGQQEGLLTALVMHSRLRERAGFRCSDEVANRLWEMTGRSTLTNFHYYPTDCPHREKNGWTGDAQLSAEQTILRFSAENSYREWLGSIRDAQREDGSLPGIVPTGGWGYDWGNGPGWDSVLTELPYMVYRYRGDTVILKENAQAIERYLDYLAQKRVDGLLAFGLADWCSPKRPAHEPKCPLVVSDTLLSMDICAKAAQIFRVLGQEEQSERAVGLREALRQSFRQQLIDADTCVVQGACQGAQAMALHYGAFEPEEEEQAFAVLLRLIEEQQGFIDCGVFGCRALFRVLSRFGRADLAYSMITRPEYPSFGNWVVQGATTLWEDFEGKSSLNHHFYGDMTAWFLQALAGLQVNPSGKDPAEVCLHPQFIPALNEVEAYIELPAGKVSVHWRRMDGGIKVEVDAPQTVRIQLPDTLCAAAGGVLPSCMRGSFTFWTGVSE